MRASPRLKCHGHIRRETYQQKDRLPNKWRPLALLAWPNNLCGRYQHDVRSGPKTDGKATHMLNKDCFTEGLPRQQEAIALDCSGVPEAQNLELHSLQDQIASVASPGNLIGASPAMRMIHVLICKAADRPFPVMILGETGTGKELVARCIHGSGPRRRAPFIAVDCSSLSPTLIESELFGHLRGAFTGADIAQKGLVEAADTGTLFLDEIGELPIELQAKLLRVIQEREVRPVGSTHSRPVNVRFIAATHRDLRDAVDKGTFRSDLFYRLNVIPIEMPPLRDRKVDIPLLVAAFLAKHADPARPIERVSDDFWRLVGSFSWPGNVRELENFVVRSIALGLGPVLRNEDGCDGPFSKKIPGYYSPMDTQSLAAVERSAILRALEATKGDKIAAARILGIGKTTLYRKLKEYRESPE
jgi:transcriptional regulator with PAS, ATPase and Fis domain